MNRLAATGFLATALLCAGCQTTSFRTAYEPVRRSQPLLGTFVTITAYGADRAQVNAAISAAFAEFRRVDSLMSLHRADSELTRLNNTAAREAVVVSPDLFRVLAKAQEIAAATDGAFDITVRPLTQLWGFIWKEYRLPSAEELARVLPLVNYRLVELDAALRTVRFTRPGVTLDLNGIAKGFAVDCALERLIAFGVTNGLVKAGGDLRVIGLPSGRDHWDIQLEDPRKAGRRATIPLRGGALSTSGNYENYFVVAGRRYGHILNPRTGLPIAGVAACTVTAPSCIESDALATACVVLGPARALAKLGGQFGIRLTVDSPIPGRSTQVVSESPQFPKP